MYVERVIGLSYPVLDSSAPKTVLGENPVIYLPISFRSLNIFLGREFVESADREVIFAIVIGLAYHETAHLISGEGMTKPHLLNNLICDSNDFNVVPKKWNGSIPYTLTLVNTTYMQGLDLIEMPLQTKADKLQTLMHLSITFLRKLRIKYHGKDVRSLPGDHQLYEIFEKIKPILRDARKAPVKKRPELVQKLYEMLKKYWIEETDKEKSNGKTKGISKKKTSFDQALENLNADLKQELTVGDSEQLKTVIKNNKIFEIIRRELQHIANQARIEETIKEKKEQQIALENIRAYDRNQPHQIEKLKEIAPHPVKVNESIANSLRKYLKILLYERAVARRKASVTGTKFSPGHFHEIKTNPEKPRIRQNIQRIRKNPVETELLLCFDRSGSMEGEKERVAQEIAGTLYKALVSISRAKIQILGFDNVPIIISDGKKLPIDIVFRKIPAGLYARGGTNFPMGLRESLMILEKSLAHKKIIFMLTDGDLYGVPSIEDLLHLARAQNIEVFCIGIEGSNKNEIEQLFGTENSLFITDIGKLPEEIKTTALNRL